MQALFRNHQIGKLFRSASRLSVSLSLRRCARQALCSAAALTFAFGPSTARADDDAERETLARIAYEVARVKQMVVDAGKRSASGALAPSSPRATFRYEWLARDLDLMLQGIRDHEDAPRQPRVVLPLRGDYRN